MQISTQHLICQLDEGFRPTKREKPNNLGLLAREDDDPQVKVCVNKKAQRENQ
jgi:hypothetical protein